jgi:hypothetical protein
MPRCEVFVVPQHVIEYFQNVVVVVVVAAVMYTFMPSFKFPDDGV